MSSLWDDSETGIVLPRFYSKKKSKLKNTHGYSHSPQLTHALNHTGRGQMKFLLEDSRDSLSSGIMAIFIYMLKICPKFCMVAYHVKHSINNLLMPFLNLQKLSLVPLSI